MTMKFYGMHQFGFIHISLFVFSQVASASVIIPYQNEAKEEGESIRAKRQATCLEQEDFVLRNNNRMLIPQTKQKNRAQMTSYNVRFTMLRNEMCSGEDITITRSYKKESRFITVPDQIHGLSEICVLPRRNIQPTRCEYECKNETVGDEGFLLSVSHLESSPEENRVTLMWNAPKEWISECSFSGYLFEIFERKDNAWLLYPNRSTEYIDCTNCTHTITNLDTMTKNYKFDVTPVFRGNKKGELRIVYTQALSECDQELENLLVTRTDYSISATWNQRRQNEHGIQYQATIKQMSNETCGKSTPITTVTTVRTDLVRSFSSKFDLEFCVEAVDETGLAYCAMEKKICQRVNASEEIKLEVEFTPPKPKDTSVTLYWVTPHTWEDSCDLLHFHLNMEGQSSSDYKSEMVYPNTSCSFGFCHYTAANSEIMENTTYSFQITPVFNGGIWGKTVGQNATTFNKLPVIPNLIKQNDMKKDVLAMFESQKNYHSCTIYATSTNNKGNHKFDCEKRRYTVKFSDLPAGCQYAIFIEVCNADGGCCSSDEVTLWTPPQLPKLLDQIQLINSSLDKIEFVLPDLKNYSNNYNGDVYIVVSSDKSKAMNMKREKLIDIVKKQNVALRGRSIPVPYVSNHDVSVIKALPMFQLEREVVLENFFNRQTARKGKAIEGKPSGEFWISIVIEVESGPFKEYQTSKFSGPYKFEVAKTSSQKSFNAVAFGWALGAVILSIVLFAVIAYTSRSREKVDITIPLKTNPKPETEKSYT